MLEEGIVDPTKVTRSALQHAASVAAMFLTTEAVVATIPEKINQIKLERVAACLYDVSSRHRIDRLIKPS